MRNATSHKKSPRAWWNLDPMVIAGSWHPLNARIRLGDVFEDDEALFAYEFTNKNYDDLKKRGVTLYIGQMDRGYAHLDQKPYYELARQASAAMHRRGIRFGVYMANTVYYESMRKEAPDCESWVARTHDGRKVHYGGEQSWRWVCCFNAPGWIHRMKQIIRIAVVDVKADLLHFDNLGVWPEPDSCHCHDCQKAFKAFLLQRYPTARAQKRRFGIEGLDHYQAPNFYLRFVQPWDLPQTSSPLAQDWIRFRCETVLNYTKTMRDYAKSLNPAICFEGNGSGITCSNRAFTHGVDPDRMLDLLDVYWDENTDAKVHPAPVRPGEPPIFDFAYRSCLVARKRKRMLIRLALDAKEIYRNLTYIGHAGILKHFGYSEMRNRNIVPLPKDVAGALAYSTKHHRLYRTAESNHRVGIFRNFESLAFNHFASHHSVAVMEQFLTNRRIGFDILMNTDFERNLYRKYKLIILPNVRYLSTEFRDKLVRFVKDGGALLVTEQTGHYNEEERVRHNPPFEEIFRKAVFAKEIREETMNYETSRQHKSSFADGSSGFVRYGKGKAAYLPRIHFAQLLPCGSDPKYNVYYKGVDSRYWREPENAVEILAMIDWLCPDHSPYQLMTGQGVYQCNVRWKDSTVGIMLFNDHPLPITNVPLILEKPARVTVYDPDQPKPYTLRTHRERNRNELILPSIRIHLMLRLEERG